MVGETVRKSLSCGRCTPWAIEHQAGAVAADAFAAPQSRLAGRRRGAQEEIGHDGWSSCAEKSGAIVSSDDQQHLVGVISTARGLRKWFAVLNVEFYGLVDNLTQLRKYLTARGRDPIVRPPLQRPAPGTQGQGSYSVTKTGKPMPYRCRKCRRYFSVKVGSCMQSSNLGCQKWGIAIYMITTSLKGRDDPYRTVVSAEGMGIEQRRNRSWAAQYLCGILVRQSDSGTGSKPSRRRLARCCLAASRAP